MFPAGLPGYVTHFVGHHVRVVERPAMGPVRATVLLIHGWGCSAFVFRKNIEPLAAQGIRTLAIDLPGHGLSDAPSAVNIDAFVDAVVDAMNALAIERAALVAH